MCTNVNTENTGLSTGESKSAARPVLQAEVAAAIEQAVAQGSAIVVVPLAQHGEAAARDVVARLDSALAQAGLKLNEEPGFLRGLCSAICGWAKGIALKVWTCSRKFLVWAMESARAIGAKVLALARCLWDGVRNVARAICDALADMVDAIVQVFKAEASEEAKVNGRTAGKNANSEASAQAALAPICS
ncbi:MAG: hypothetical protein ABSE73_12020 [Planctomycetota bacterium]